MVYDPLSGQYSINPPAIEDANSHLIYHEDSYRVSVDLNTVRPYPATREISDKILTTLESKKLTRPDLHLNSDSTFCLEAIQELERAFQDGFSIGKYVNQFLIPFLFEQTHFRLTGQWAWKPLPHFEAGPLEWYYLKGAQNSVDDAILTIRAIAATQTNPRDFLNIITKRQIKRLDRCFCRSGKAIIHCCPNSMYGYKKLRKVLLKTRPDQVKASINRIIDGVASPTPPLPNSL